MIQTRRSFLRKGTAFGVAAMLSRPLLAADDIRALTARAAHMQLVPPEYPQTEIWGYDGLMPGPEIRVTQGERIRRRFVNDLPQASSVHWHGIRIDNAMDGVAGLTQDAVPPGGEFDYDFVAPDAGTFWFHAHNRSAEQVARGLYGALIVVEPQAPDIDREEVLILDDWLLDPETAQIMDDSASMHTRSHSGSWGNFIATNARYDLNLTARRNERLRLRIINAANARIFQLGLAGLDGWVMALDGMPLASPEPFSDVIALGPAQRVDLFVDVVAEPGETAHLVRLGDNEPFSQVAFDVDGTASAARRGPPPALPPNPLMDVVGIADARRLSLRMEGGAMGRMMAATLDGERKSMRELVQENQFWAFNGAVGMTDRPLAKASPGETVRLEIANDTAFPHAMHLHGMHFREVIGGDDLGPLRDTLLMLRGETREIAFTAHNPGKWLFHCHMLSHAASGMTTWLDVA